MQRRVALFAFSGLCALSGSACSARTVAPTSVAAADADDSGLGGAFPAVDPPSMDDVDGPASSTDPSSGAEDAAKDGGGDDGDTAPSAPDGPGGAIPDGACAQPLNVGDLKIDEIMIDSVAGAGDDGEWLEVESALDCTANLSALHGECPRGAKVATFDVTGDLWLPPHGTFVVADSNDPAINHDLPGLVVVWFGHEGDVLRNNGSTITLSLNGNRIDTVTYPALPLAVGTSVAFPNDCDADLRSDFAHWKRSTTSWFPAFFGTPNAPNTDIECP